MAFQQFPQKGGIPSGNTAARPSGPVIGDTYYNGELGLLEIYNGTNWVPSSAPPGIPTMTVTDVGTSRAYTSGAIAFTLIAGTNGGSPLGYTGTATSGVPATYTTGTTSSLTPTLSVGIPGSYDASANAFNGFGTSPSTTTQTVTVTTVPQAPTIGTTTFASNGLPIVNWTLGNNGGKNLTSITITPYLNGTTAQTSVTAATTSSTSYTFTSGLTEDASYTFTVKAANANGTGLESSASNSVTVNQTFSVDFLVVAGGGGGGHGDVDARQSSGGGAGGLRSSYGATGGGGSLESAITVTKGTNYTVTIGAGGALAGDGNNSVFSTITSLKGGFGGGGGGTNGGGGSGTYGSGGGQGGSGGGGSANNAAGTAGQGFQGGSAVIGQDSAGGGGGAGSAGGDASGTTAGVGGNGINNSITGASVGYAGGAGNNGDLGFGGGYNGSAGTRAAVANKGGGGKGSVSGTGGSGVVILRWLTAAGSITVGNGLTADATGTDGSYSYKRITAGSGNVSF